MLTVTWKEVSKVFRCLNRTQKDLTFSWKSIEDEFGKF